MPRPAQDVREVEAFLQYLVHSCSSNGLRFFQSELEPCPLADQGDRSSTDQQRALYQQADVGQVLTSLQMHLCLGLHGQHTEDANDLMHLMTLGRKLNDCQ